MTQPNQTSPEIKRFYAAMLREHARRRINELEEKKDKVKHLPLIFEFHNYAYRRELQLYAVIIRNTERFKFEDKTATFFTGRVKDKAYNTQHF